MKHNYANILWVLQTQGNRLAKNSMMFFGVLILMFFSSLRLVGQGTVTPIYEWLDKRDLATVNFGLSGINSEDIVVSIATDPAGNVYTLSFGNGVNKRDSNGNLIKAGFIPASELDNPLDIAIDETGMIYIADYFAGGTTFADNGKIKVFDPSGTYLPNRTILTSFFRPMGIDVDNENVYIAEYNDGNQGPEKNQYSRIEIVNKLDSSIRIGIDDIGGEAYPKVPYRIAVDSQKNVYVSQAGNNNPQVLVFDSNLKNPVPLPNITSAGSIVIDDFGFIHVLEYAGRVDFEKFINYDNVGISEGLAIAKNIRDGIRNKEFTIKIFDSNRVLVKTLVDNNANDLNIEFPLDITFDSCNKMYLNNSEIFGGDIIFIGYVPSRLEFDLEIYNRTPSFDTQKPIAVTCPEDQNEKLTGGSLILPDYRSLAIFTDNCDTDLTLVQNPAVGSIITSTSTTVIITAKDDAGNVSEACSFKVIIETEADTEPPVITCPNSITKNVDPGQCGTVVTFANATAIDNSGDTPTITRVDITGLNSGDLFPVGQTTISYRATDEAGNFKDCDFTITVTDNEKPTIACPANISETVAFGESGKVINYTAPTFDDNCSQSTITQTAGFASGSEFPVGITTNTFEVTDASGLKETCSFNITITENAEPQSPTFDCPDPNQTTVLALDENCSYIVPNYSDKIINFENFENSPFFIQSDNRTENSLSVNIEVYDGEGGDLVGECIFIVDLRDSIPPEINCPSEIVVEYTTDKTYTVPDFSSLYSSSDNCSTTLGYVQTPEAGTEITEDMGASFRVSDENNNFTTCNFNIKFIKSTDLKITNCPTEQTFEVDSNCSYLIPDIATAIETNINGAVITQSIEPGFSVNNSLTLTITAKFEDQIDTCKVELLAKDSIDPDVICPEDQNETFNPANGFSLPNYTLQAQGSDNCEVAKIEQIPNVGTVIFEDTEVTIRIEDATGNSATCSFNVILTEENTEDTVVCKESIVLELDENGIANLNGAELFTTRPENLEFFIDQNLFTCDDLGENTVKLSYSNTEIEGSCEVKIIVKDVSAPILSIKDISVALNEFGSVRITPEMLDNGSTDNCENLSFSLSKLNFGCKELGENTVTFTATDSSGNSSSTTAMVTITGNCEIGPEEGVEYIFIYPNPTSGPFQFATPTGVTIERVEVFDARGRMIMFKEYSAVDLQYNMDLSGVQNAVYILKLFTSEGMDIKRVIIN